MGDPDRDRRGPYVTTKWIDKALDVLRNVPWQNPQVPPPSGITVFAAMMRRRRMSNVDDLV